MNASTPKHTRSQVSIRCRRYRTHSPAPLHLAPVGAKAVALDFDGGRLSSDAGLVLLKDPDEQLGLTRALWRRCSETHAIRDGSTLPSTTCSSNACCKLPRAMKMPTMPTPCATIPSSKCCSIACPKAVPPWPRNRRSHALKIASHAPNSTAWRGCLWINLSPLTTGRPSSSSSTSMTPRTRPMASRSNPLRWLLWGLLLPAPPRV